MTIEPVLSIRGLAVQRGPTLALSRADLTISRPGEVHALLGQNGSGKSTLLGVLSGQLRPVRGEVLLNGTPLRFADTAGSRGRGVATVSQERALAPDLSVTENILMGRGLVNRGAISWRKSADIAARTLSDLGFEIDPSARTGSLRADQQQLVEIARAVAGDPRLLVLDEPTSSLSQDEVSALFEVVRRLSVRGVSTIIVSHRLAELFEICDHITVLRDGATVYEAEMGATTQDLLIEAMVGSLPASRATARPILRQDAPERFRAARIEAAPAVRAVDLELRSGEIVGVTGLAGSGASQLLEVVAGTRPASGGSMTLDGADFRPTSVRNAITSGVTYLPPDRKTQGIHLGMSIADNLALTFTRTRPRLMRPRRKAEDARARTLIDRFHIRTPSSGVHVRSLSGGNQQKVAIGKCVDPEPRVLVLDEPTRGVDVAARRDIHTQLHALAEGGLSILVHSGDVDELLEFCHRIVVMNRGRVAGDVISSTSDEKTVAQLAGGGE